MKKVIVVSGGNGPNQDDSGPGVVGVAGTMLVVGLAGLNAAQQIGEHGCDPRELCQIGNVHQPDEPAHKDPVSPLGKLRLTVVSSATSTIGAINSTINWIVRR